MSQDTCGSGFHCLDPRQSLKFYEHILFHEQPLAPFLSFLNTYYLTIHDNGFRCLILTGVSDPQPDVPWLPKDNAARPTARRPAGARPVPQDGVPRRMPRH